MLVSLSQNGSYGESESQPSRVFICSENSDSFQNKSVQFQLPVKQQTRLTLKHCYRGERNRTSVKNTDLVPCVNFSNLLYFFKMSTWYHTFSLTYGWTGFLWCTTLRDPSDWFVRASGNHEECYSTPAGIRSVLQLLLIMLDKDWLFCFTLCASNSRKKTFLIIYKCLIFLPPNDHCNRAPCGSIGNLGGCLIPMIRLHVIYCLFDTPPISCF